MQPSSTSTSLHSVEPLVITEAWSGDPKSCQTLEFPRSEHALLDVTQGLVRWCKDSIMQWFALWLQQRFNAVVVEELSPTILQQLDVIVASVAELKRQQQLIHTSLEGLRYSQRCCCKSGNPLETPRTETTTLFRKSTQEEDHLLIVQEIDDYVELNFEDEARVE
ncbi:hypothetical protein KXD40_009036 [Peronospora effusa]|nr:hypothetical protein KXD40_009036 [Peronospora effusa]